MRDNLFVAIAALACNSPALIRPRYVRTRGTERLRAGSVAGCENDVSLWASCLVWRNARYFAGVILLDDSGWRSLVALGIFRLSEGLIYNACESSCGGARSSLAMIMGLAIVILIATFAYPEFLEYALSVLRKILRDIIANVFFQSILFLV